jgi:hypothetical protein
VRRPGIDYEASARTQSGRANRFALYRHQSEGDAEGQRSRRGPQAIAEENAELVEALSAEEFAEEHITGAMNIPLKQLDERAKRLRGQDPEPAGCEAHD